MARSNEWALKLYQPGALYPGGLVPDFSLKLEESLPWLFPKPKTPEELGPMQKGKPQEPASPYQDGKTLPERVAGEVTKQITEPFRVAWEYWYPDRVVDIAVYAGGAIILLLAIWAVIK